MVIDQKILRPSLSRVREVRVCLCICVLVYVYVCAYLCMYVCLCKTVH